MSFFKNNQAVGIIDFDTAHPGPRILDVAYAVYRWSPLTHHSNSYGFDDIQTQISKAKIFCDAYGLTYAEKASLPRLIILRLTALVDYMIQQASSSNYIYQHHIKNGHHLIYQTDIAYIETLHNHIIDVLTSC